MKRLKLIIFIFLMLVIPINIYAYDGETDKLYINIDILDNGDINVQELASLKGSYNGRLRDIRYADNTIKDFIGEKSDFEGSKIYNGTSIENLQVYGVLNKNTITYDTIFDESKRTDLFQEVESANNGDDGVYTKSDLYTGVNLKIFNPSKTNKAFLITYTIKDVVVVHDDVAEIAWKILGDSYVDDIDDLEVHVNLPGNDDDMRVFLHGPLNGYIERVEGKHAKITYDFLPRNNYVSARVMFNKNLVPNATKLSNTKGKMFILEAEQKWADEANEIRNRVKMQYYSVVIPSYCLIGLLILMYIILKIKQKNNLKTNFEQDYLRDFPREYGPETLEYLMNKNITEKSFSASLLMIIEKKALKVEKDVNSKKKDAYILIKQEDFVKDLTEREKDILTLIIDTIGNGEQVTIEEIKKYGKKTSNARKMMNKFRKWQSASIKDAEKEEFYIKKVPFKKKIYIVGVISIILAIIIMCLTATTHFRTEKGALEYNEWYALKHFMLDFGDMDVKELPEVSIWGKYLVYASILGCAKQLEKTMKIRIKDMEVNDSLYDYYLYNSFTDNMSITSTITDSMNNAFSVSKSSIAASESSSGSGFGGGASSGGGSFGGGGGGGHF